MSGIATIAQAVAIGRQQAALYRPDAYSVVRQVLASDGAGGETGTPTTEESGYCILTAGARLPTELAIASEAGATVPYVARNLKFDTVVQARDTLVIGGRNFLVLGVLRNEQTRVAVSAVCEERQ